MSLDPKATYDGKLVIHMTHHELREALGHKALETMVCYQEMTLEQAKRVYERMKGYGYE